MNPVFIQAVGMLAPGLFGWGNARGVLSGDREYQPENLPALKPEMLKPNERRRISNTIKLALQAIQDGLGAHSLANDLAMVFATAEGDLEIVDKICQALDQIDRPVSPTHFHNSVHNAPAGYASIASGSQNASTSIGALGGSFASGLLEAAVQSCTDQQPVMLIAYDYPVPFPLSEPIPITLPFATSLLLSAQPNADGNLARLDLRLECDGEESRLADAQLERLRLDNPAAKSLPLLQALASGRQQQLTLPYLQELNLAVGISPC
ncbi:MAG: beta-ketoacyl synthase chain length factor [Pseudomonadota bacterium]